MFSTMKIEISLEEYFSHEYSRNGQKLNLLKAQKS